MSAAEKLSRLRHPAGSGTARKRLAVARQGALLSVQMVSNAVAGLAASSVAIAAAGVDSIDGWLRLALALTGLGNLAIVVAWARHGARLLRAHLPVVREHKTNNKQRGTR